MSGIASGYKGTADGNQSGLATNASANKDNQPDAPSASDIAGTLPADFSLKNTKMDAKGGDLTTSNESEGRPGEPLSSAAGAGGESKRTELQVRRSSVFSPRTV